MLSPLLDKFYHFAEVEGHEISNVTVEMRTIPMNLLFAIRAEKSQQYFHSIRLMVPIQRRDQVESRNVRHWVGTQMRDRELYESTI